MASFLLGDDVRGLRRALISRTIQGIGRPQFCYAASMFVACCPLCTNGEAQSLKDKDVTPAKMLNPFKSFDMSVMEVTSDNVPSARDVSRMLPSVQQLRSQLPSAKSLEQKYMQSREGGRIDSADATNSSVATTRVLCTPIRLERSLFAGSADMASPPSATKSVSTDSGDDKSGISVKQDEACSITLEQELNPLQGEDKERWSAELNSGAETSSSELNGSHVLLAYKALMWGTVYAIVGFIIIVGLSMRLCGFYSIEDLKKGVRDKFERENERALLHWRAGVGESSGTDKVEHFVIDLSDKTNAWAQIRASWKAIQDMAEQEEGVS